MYERQVDRSNPGCIIFLLDQSYSMTDGLAATPKRKCDAVADAINRLVGELITICEKGEEKPRHYFDVSIIGYTTDKAGNPTIGSMLQGPLAGRDLVTIIDLFDNPLDIEKRERQQDDGAGGLIKVSINFPVWYRVPSPEQMAGTPMCGAVNKVTQVAGDWCALHPNSFPPIVFHLTDGESTDGSPEPYADALRALQTSDGNVLMFNCHLSNLPPATAMPILLPADEGQLYDDYSRILFRMSSTLPDKMRQMAEAKSISASPGARCMAFNADSVAMLQLISVGTVVASNLR